MSCHRVRLRRRAWVLAPLALASSATMLLAALGSPVARAAEAAPGGSGTDTSLPLTESAKTVSGRGRFASMEFTVNQTEQLNNQAISITWTGGTPTVVGVGPMSNYVQIMQCWGDDDGTVPENPGPPPEQCVQGAEWPEFVPGNLAGYAGTRVISRKDFPGYDASVGYTDNDTPDLGSALVWRPFRAVDGTVVKKSRNARFNGQGDFWQNPYFNNITTNEIFAGRTDQRGRGSELFEVQTGTENSGLGCGKRAEPVAGGERKVPQCWLVIVPRGTPVDENVGVPVNTGEVVTSPLTPHAWQNRIAVPLQFNPTESPCGINEQALRISGNEVALPAVNSWQPALCALDGLPPFAYSKSTDSLARQQVANPTASSPGMIVVSRPLSDSQTNPDNPVVYSPLALSGLAIGFNIERPVNKGAETTPEEEKELNAVRVAQLNLTPRLVAKLLTQSYTSQNPNFMPPADWQVNNPYDLGTDPDFLAYNPEFAYFNRIGRPLGGLALPLGNSDAARQVWQWVLADPEAKAWLDGEPDAGKMRVNPAYQTKVEPPAIPFGDPIPESFPKNDPTCYQEPPYNDVDPPALCGADWMPYMADGFIQAAKTARAGSLRAKIVRNPNPQGPTDVWKTEQPPVPGTKAILAITDVASAMKFGVQMASLSRAGDDGADREFIAPNATTITAGLKAMEPGTNPAVLEPVAGKVAPGAYPLTTMSYAAVAPYSLNKSERLDYAAFLDYAANGPGQTPGFAPGDLPAGYVPLPAELQATAAVAAQAILDTVLPRPGPTQITAPSTTMPDSTSSTSTSTSPPPPPSSSSTTTTQPRRSNGTTTTRAPSSTTSTTSTTVAAPATDTAPPPSPPPTVPAEPEEPSPPGFTPATPVLALARSRYAVPGLGAVALGSGLGALEITKRPRRASSAKPPIAPIGGG